VCAYASPPNPNPNQLKAAAAGDESSATAIAMLEEAGTWLQQAMRMQPKDVATCYNLACCSALAGNSGACRHALEHAVSVVLSGKAEAGGTTNRASAAGQPRWADTTPSVGRQDLAEDEDLESVRGEEWFSVLVQSIPS
jgi:hypothetical protein